MIKYIIIIVVIAFLTLIIIDRLRKSSLNSNVESASEVFQQWKHRLKPNCSGKDVEEFMQFLKKYQGGYIKKKSGKVVYRDYLGQEKGDLKGIFFNIIFPNPNIEITDKENFRHLILSKGVNGVSNRPDYETRDSKLTNRNTKQDDYNRKEVGNRGEQMVRSALVMLNRQDYSIINGPKFRFNDVIKEFDHIVVGETGLFVIETKAFGMTDGKSSKASLFIDPGDKWIIRKNKNNREVASPTQQLLAEKKMLEDILSSYIVNIHPVLVLSNKELFVKNNIELPYDIVRVDELNEYILSYKYSIFENERILILNQLDKVRIN